MNTSHFIKNACRVLQDPEMFNAYAQWLINKLLGGVVLPTHFGAKLGDFENFSNYWSTKNKIPSQEQFRWMANCIDSSTNVIIDIGANIGLFSVALGKLCSEADIHAFEPVPSTFDILNKNINRNYLSNVITHNSAIADDQKKVHISTDMNASQKNRILKKETEGSHEVEAISIDYFCAKNNFNKVAFVKIDVEGAEPLVLRGAKKMLMSASVNAVLLEVCEENLNNLGFTIEDLKSEISGFPYEVYTFAINGQINQKVDLSDLINIRSTDVVLIPK